MLLRCTCALVLLAGIAGCGGDDESNTASQTAPVTTGAQQNPERTIGKETETQTNTQERATPESRRTAADLRGQLRQEGRAGDIDSVQIGHTLITIRTGLTDSAKGREEASSICAETRRFLAQRPALGTAGRVAITGPAGGVITEC